MVCLSPLKLRVRISLRRGVLDTTLCDKVCQWFSLGTPVSSTNKTDHHEVHDITENVLKVALKLFQKKKYQKIRQVSLYIAEIIISGN
jgi:hypothetical protein